MNAGGPPPPQGFEREPLPAGPDSPRQVQIRAPRGKPYVTYTLMALTILVFLAQMASQFLTGEDWPALLGMKVNELILRGQIWRLITPMFLHASIIHIGFNMYALNIFGPGLERHFGHLRFLTLYLLSAFAGNVLSFVFSLAPSLGASTAVFGLLGAEGVFLYQNRELLGGSARAALTNIVTIAVINLLIGLRPGIDNWGHVGGLIGGTLFTWLGGPRLQVEGIYPSLSVSDDRESGDVVRAAIVVGALFVLIAGGIFYLRGGIR